MHVHCVVEVKIHKHYRCLPRTVFCFISSRLELLFFNAFITMNTCVQHLIHFMHNKGKGLNLDILNTTSVSWERLVGAVGFVSLLTKPRDVLFLPWSWVTLLAQCCSQSIGLIFFFFFFFLMQEYLQGLLNIMTRSTDQLIGIFTKLNAFVSVLHVVNIGMPMPSYNSGIIVLV